MKLQTWSIYKGKKLKNLEGQTLVEKEFPFVLLRPDLNKENRVLGIVINGEYANTSILDLQNRILSSDHIYDIFKDKLGLVDIADISEYHLGSENISQNSIRQENIQILVDVYNIFIKKEVITFESDDYSTIEKIRQQPDLFSDVNLETMPLPQLLNTLGAGLQDYNDKMTLIKQETDEEAKVLKVLNVSNLQSNLIVFFDETLKRFDEIIKNQAKELENLRQELANFKKNKGE
ncbi:hypothetical protein ESOMN_v1c01180 [Williamsoniiplasma somnilux]|uniref:Uncharacterized protein n=1 Tax=Williamsoniiplasma somnilux TaxID=215578 RepID=A0A2K8P0T2_9MOLU|nr:hypothetical protein [Williamsoniiplasma somnilux]ATZ18503.1 hypothetical protein ESOMN_v1c01180 [Williamsoniiplasma somnilux]